MKTMTCKQLGGACDMKFQAASFEEIAQMSQRHGMEMFEKKDEAHIKAMNKIKKLMSDPKDMEAWMKKKQDEFEALPED
ncbi:MAG: hypothetical protein MI892_18235 [Desulfobacterales bacterium]|nr:hypothetical protein [Desulfobacterales bacterium]